MRARIAELETKLALYRRMETLELACQDQHVRHQAREAHLGLLRAVCDAFHVPIAALFTRARTRSIADARQVAMALIYQQEQLTLSKVGQIFTLDHGTVLHAIRAVASKETGDRAFAAQLAQVRAALAATLQGARVLSTQHSALSTQHSALSALSTQHSALSAHDS